MTQMVKNLPAMQETWVPFLGQEHPLEKGMGTHSSTLAWSIPWTEKPVGLQSMGLQRVRHNWATNTHTDYMHLYSNAVVKYNYIHMYTYVYVIIYIYTYTQICMCVCVCVCIYIDIYIYIYIYIYSFNGGKGPQRQKCPGPMRVKMLL